MKRFKGALVALLFVIAAIMPISTTSTPAHAASPYDDVVSLSDGNIVLHNTNVSMRLDQHWYAETVEVVQEKLQLAPDYAAYQRYLNLLDGDWFVYTYQSHIGYSFLYVYYTGQAQGAATATFTHDCESWRPSPCLKLTSTVPLYEAVFEIKQNGDKQGFLGEVEDAFYVKGYPSSTDAYDIVMSTFNITYPVGYEGEYIPDTYTPPAVTYVAMGDSFSSGEGNPPFMSGTDEGGVNECHRSRQAYPHILSNYPLSGLGPVDFVACSGATTTDVLYGGSGTGNWNEGPQIDALSGDTEIVTITVGGNDVGFRGYVETCVFWICGPGTSGFNAIMSNINSTSFLDDLKNVYGSILESAPKATVYVVGYPHIFDPGGGSFGCDIIDSSGATLVIDGLNATIGLAVAQVRSQSIDHSNRLHFVSATASGSPFEGKHLCTDDGDGPSFYPLMTYVVYSLHPNVNGQTNYYQLMKEVMQ